MKENYLSIAIFSFTVHEKAFQIISCTVIGKVDTKKNGYNVSYLLVMCGPRVGDHGYIIHHLFQMYNTTNTCQIVYNISEFEF